jgi:hypothetical protein
MIGDLAIKMAQAYAIAATAGKGVKVLASYLSQNKFELLPIDLRGISDTASLVGLLQRSFSRSARLEFSDLISLKSSDLVKLISFEFKHLTSGFCLWSQFTASYPNRAVHEVFDFVTHLLLFINQFACDIAHWIITCFVDPLRKLAISYSPKIILEFVSDRMSLLSLANGCPSYVDRLTTWITANRLDGDPHSPPVLECVSLLHDYDRQVLRDFMSASSSAVGNSPSSLPARRPSNVASAPLPSKTVSSSPAKSSPPKQKIDYGVCLGYCLSIFFDKPCPRLTANKPCSTLHHSSTGAVIKTPLIHIDAFKKLPPAKQASLQSFFDNSISPSLTSVQVEFYST